jgi:hypothetical protein
MTSVVLMRMRRKRSPPGRGRYGSRRLRKSAATQSRRGGGAKAPARNAAAKRTARPRR